MRILILAPSLPLPFGLTDGKWLHVVTAELARRGHSVRCISCTEEPAGRIEEAGRIAAAAGFEFRHVRLSVPESWVTRKVRSFARPFSQLARTPELVAALREAFETKPDVLHVEHLYSSWACLGHERMVVYLHNLETVDREGRRSSPRERLELWRIRRATGRLLRRQSRLIAMTPRLEAAASEVNPDLRTRVVPLGLETDGYPRLDPVTAPTVGVIGSMYWQPSRLAAERLMTRLWPEVRRRMPEARLLVAGRQSERYLSRHLPLDGAEMLGEVASPEEFFSRVAVLVYAPPRGTGMKVKVLESMAYGVPVVSNEEGFEGLDCEDGVHCLRAETDAEFVEQTVELLGDPDRRRRLADAGRELILRDHGPTPTIDRLLAAYEALL